jgi:hypothetical protein
MPRVLKNFSSQLVNCPVCKKEVRSRGLYTHLRLKHPEVDAKQKLRNVLINPLKDPQQRIIFQVSLNQKDEYCVKHALLNLEQMQFIQKILSGFSKGKKTSEIRNWIHSE